MNSHFIFYGACSGELGYSDCKLFPKAAETLLITLKRRHPFDSVTIHRALTKEQLLEPLLTSTSPIQQVHIICNCDSQGLYFEGTKKQRDRLTPRASRWIRLGRRFDLVEGAALPLEERTRKNLEHEPSLLSGYLSTTLDELDLETLKQNHADDATWHIWGGNAGQYLVQFGDPTSPIRSAYLKQFNQSAAGAPGIAVDIAKSLGVSCTATQGSGKWNAFGATRTRKVQKLNTHDRLPVPIWLWPSRSDNWVTITPSGAIDTTPSILDQHLGLSGTPAKSVAPLFWSKPKLAQGSGPAPGLTTGQGGPKKKKPVQPTPLTITFQPNDSNTRAFFPKRNDPNHLAGKIKLKAVLAGTIPPKATYEWTVNKKDGVKFTKPNALETEILARKSGKMTITFQINPPGKPAIKKTTPISVPEFVLVQEYKGLTLALGKYKLEGQKDQIVREMRMVAEKLLKTANVRLVWRAGPFNESLPAFKQSDRIQKKLLYNEALLLDLHPIAKKKWEAGRATAPVNLRPGPSRYDELIGIFFGVYALKPPTTPAPRAPINELFWQAKLLLAQPTTRKNSIAVKNIKHIMATMLARLMGSTLAHEILHSLLPDAKHRDKEGHNIPLIQTKAPDGMFETTHQKPFLMNPGPTQRQLSLVQLTGIELKGRDSFPRKGSFVDHGYSRAAIKIHPLNQKLIDRHFPVRP